MLTYHMSISIYRLARKPKRMEGSHSSPFLSSTTLVKQVHRRQIDGRAPGEEDTGEAGGWLRNSKGIWGHLSLSGGRQGHCSRKAQERETIFFWSGRWTGGTNGPLGNCTSIRTMGSLLRRPSQPMLCQWQQECLVLVLHRAGSPPQRPHKPHHGAP